MWKIILLLLSLFLLVSCNNEVKPENIKDSKTKQAVILLKKAVVENQKQLIPEIVSQKTDNISKSLENFIDSNHKYRTTSEINKAFYKIDYWKLAGDHFRIGIQYNGQDPYSFDFYLENTSYKLKNIKYCD